jgi:hypothetical protein
MPAGTLQQKIDDLQQALAAISTLLGTAGDNNSPGSGFAGGATLSVNAPGAQITAFQGNFSASVSGVLQFDATTSLDGVTEFIDALQADASLSPTDALSAFAEQVAQVDASFAGDFTQDTQAILSAVKGISDGIPQDRTAVISALVDQVVRVLGSLQGPEAQKIQAWLQAAMEMQERLLPLVEEARNAPDPAAVALAVIERALGSTLNTFGFTDIERFFRFLDRYVPTLVPDELLTNITSAHNAATAALDLTLGAVNAEFSDFHDAAVGTARSMNLLSEHLHELAVTLQGLTEARFLQPHALEKFLQSKIDEVLAVELQEVQKIDDPFKALFDRVDAAIAGIDLSFVQNDVLSFFTQTRDKLQQINIPNLAERLQTQLAPVQAAVQQLQQSVTELLAQIRDFFAGLVEKYRDLAENVGSFQPDGSFQFRVEQGLRQLFANARNTIVGDPNDPDAFSITRSLQQLQTTIADFLEQLTEILAPLQANLQPVADAAVSAIGDFMAFLQGLNIPGLIQQLQETLQHMVDAVGTVSFDVVVDPVVEGINENTEKLRSIDPSQINDMLRAALKAALDVVISVDFTGTISTPLKDEFAKVKAVPQQGIDDLQHRYEQAIAVLEQLKPTQLLQALFAAFDVIHQAVGSLSITPLLKPLDDLHKQFLEQPLATLKPSTLLQPVSTAFQQATSQFATIKGDALIAPLNQALTSVKAKVVAFDGSKFIDDLLQAIEKIKQDLRDIRPSTILSTLLPEVTRLQSELDRFKPSTLLQPLTALATPLLELLETVQQQTIQALFDLFQAPLQLLDRARPQALTQGIQQQLDALVARIESLNIAALHNQLKGGYFDLSLAVEANGSAARLNLTTQLCDPDKILGELVTAQSDLLTVIKGLRSNVELPSLTDSYEAVRTRLIGLLPAYAQQVLDPETFKRFMRLADPTRFAQELDERFEQVKAKLLPIDPQQIAAQLDATYEAVLAEVEALDVTASLNQIKQVFAQLTGIVNSIRVDFLAHDIDTAVQDLHAVLAALDPGRLLAELDALHHDIEVAVQQSLPSVTLIGLQGPLDDIKQTVTAVDPRPLLGTPLDQAWEPVQNALAQIDFRVILKPLVDKLDELEAEFELSLRKTEDAFDGLLGAASTALGGAVGGSVSVEVSL